MEVTLCHFNARKALLFLQSGIYFASCTYIRIAYKVCIYASNIVVILKEFAFLEFHCISKHDIAKTHC